MSDTRRVLFLAAAWDHGGQEKVVIQAINLLDSIGWSAALGVGEVKTFRCVGEDLRLTELGRLVPLTWRKPVRFVRSVVKFGLSLRRLIKKHRPGVVVCLDVHSAWLNFIFGCRPAALWAHFSIKKYYARFGKWPLHRLLLRRLDALVVLNDQMRMETLDCVNPEMEERVYVINNAITAQYHGNLYEPSTQRLIYVGRLENRQKRIDRLLRALAFIKDLEWELWLFGDGPHREELQSLAEELGISDRVLFKGWSKDPWQDVADAGGAKALVLTSDYEGHGQVLVEAMYHGLPCVATDCPVGPSEIIKDGINGFLVPLSSDEEETVRLLAKKLGELLSSAEFDSVKVSQSVEKYLPQNVAKQWDEFLRCVVSKRGGRYVCLHGRRTEAVRLE